MNRIGLVDEQRPHSIGIQRAEQERLAAAGHRSVVLVAYGTFWYPWFVRRLAERPANLWFMARNMFAS